MDISPVNITIAAPPEVFNVSEDEVGYVLTFYSTPSLFQIKAPEGVNESDFEFVADSAVVGLTINRNNTELTDLNEPVFITLQSLRALQGEVSYEAKQCTFLHNAHSRMQRPSSTCGGIFSTCRGPALHADVGVTS